MTAVADRTAPPTVSSFVSVSGGGFPSRAAAALGARLRATRRVHVAGLPRRPYGNAAGPSKAPAQAAPAPQRPTPTPRPAAPPAFKQTMLQVAHGSTSAACEAPSYFLATDGSYKTFRVTPPRINGRTASVSWGLDDAGGQVAVHVTRRHAKRYLDRRALEWAALAAIGPEVAPRAEYVDGEARHVRISPLWQTDLFTVLDQLKEGEAIRWVARKVLRDVADNLVRLHAQGIAHNDIKPENILVRTTGELALTDVDGAFVTDPSEPSILRGAGLGTPSYPCPEACDLHQALRATTQVDTFRLGTCLLSLYDSWSYLDATAETGGAKARSLADEQGRAADNLGLLARLQAARRGEVVLPLQDSELAVRASALEVVADRMQELDPEMHDFVLFNLLAREPTARPTASQLLATGTALLPHGSPDEARAVAALQHALEASPEVAQQRRDFDALAQMPPSLAPIQP